KVHFACPLLCHTVDLYSFFRWLVRGTIQEILFRKVATIPNDPFFELILSPRNRFPIRVQNQVTRITEEFHSISTWFKYIKVISLTDPVFGRSGFNDNIIFDE